MEKKFKVGDIVILNHLFLEVFEKDCPKIIELYFGEDLLIECFTGGGFYEVICLKKSFLPILQVHQDHLILIKAKNVYSEDNTRYSDRFSPHIAPHRPINQFDSPKNP